ncbi:MAG: hypothetical protein AABZ47_02060 [Planctomycetota bacterium]
MRMYRFCSLILVPMTLATSACVPGYNSMVFATKTNAGLIVDTQPPEVNVDIGRQEFLISPTFEGGQTPPVLSSFRWDNEGLFRQNYLGSTFTTGDAAVTMARLYSAPDWPDASKEKVWDLTADKWNAKEKFFDSEIELKEIPETPWFVPKYKPNQVRPVLFGTDTSFGFKIAWKNPESPVPDYLRLAYQRRELAFAAVNIGPNDENASKPYEARVPSLLASLDANLQVEQPWKSGFGYLQYFSSGKAATALAFRHAVRTAMLKRLDPEQAKEVEKDEKRVASNNAAGNIEFQDALARSLSTATPVTTCAAADKALCDRVINRKLAGGAPATPPPTVTQGELNREILRDFLKQKGKYESPGDEVLWMANPSPSEVAEVRILLGIP